MNNSILDPFKKSDWFHPSDLAAKQAKAIFEGKPKPKLSTEYWDITYLDALSSNSEPMGAIKRKEPEQTQESPSKEIIKALVFVLVCVLIAAIYYNAYIFWITEYKPTELPPMDKIYSFAFAIGLPIAMLIVILSGNLDDWLKQNIDPYLLKIKSWLNRRNEQ